jgi:hypothetical protein
MIVVRGRNLVNFGCGFAGALLFFLVTSASSAFAQRVQAGSKACSWTKSCTVTSPTNMSAGDSVAVAVNVNTWQTGPQTPNVTDSQANSYALVVSVGSTFLFCAPNVAAGPNSVTSTIAVANNQDLVILEFRGSCTVDRFTTAEGSSALAATPSIPVHAGDFFIAGVTSTYSNTFQPSTGFTTEAGPGNFAIADSLQSAAGNQSITFTLGSTTNWTALLVGFSPAASTAFNTTATLKWDDGTPVAGTVTIAQEISSNPLTMNSLGSFPLDTSGVAKGTVSPDPALPLTFFVTLVSPSGTVVNSMTLFTNAQILKELPRILNPSIVLAKLNATVKSVSF